MSSGCARGRPSCSSMKSTALTNPNRCADTDLTHWETGEKAKAYFRSPVSSSAVNVCYLQDTFLPHVECGTVILIGATTENPSFQVNAALLSRCRVLVLEKLSVEAMASILDRAVATLGIRVLEEDSTLPRDGGQTAGQE